MDVRTRQGIGSHQGTSVYHLASSVIFFFVIFHPPQFVRGARGRPEIFLSLLHAGGLIDGPEDSVVPCSSGHKMAKQQLVLVVISDNKQAAVESFDMMFVVDARNEG